MNQKGIAHILIIFAVIVILFALAAGLLFTGVIKNPFAQTKTVPKAAVEQSPSLVVPTNPPLSQLTPAPASSSSQNPFDESQQDLNPFSSYLNPFDNLQ